MSARILDGKAVAAQIEAEIADQTVEFIQNNAIQPCLAAVLVGEDPASGVYIRNKQKACERANIESRLHRLPADISEDELLQLLAKLNKADDVHGILVQLPLPDHINEARILRAVNPLKDVDAFHPENVGRIVQGQPRFLPCTPHGIQQLLIRENITIAGSHVVVVGRSDIVGKPIANMLVQRGTDATVTVCHSRTQDLPAITRLADILVVAIGRPRFVTADMVKPGATVIDVGINRTDKGLVGDVDYTAVREVAGAITPVPGGVGPLTVVMLLYNTLRAAQKTA
ncbi:MAG: bifunctional methylenetetrahydrofolate dehydrogenase/methenyltetrahydrofolate cyclohydrolase FolD [Planctomycetota bacterium]|nr:bifunctional methylenetetrahydrofolate dehydrogenase/methenyltetrahydrofolate cyclohydrolase FolD [Planctomycetota bacterium]